MQIRIDSVSDIKTDQRGTSAKIKSGNDSYFVNEDPTQYIGKDVEVDITEKTSQRGNKYKIAKILKVVEGAKGAGSAGSNGHISWDDYRQMAEAAHELAKKLEPDDSAARAAIINTVMIAFSNGKIANPFADDDIPF